MKAMIVYAFKLFNTTAIFESTDTSFNTTTYFD